VARHPTRSEPAEEELRARDSLIEELQRELDAARCEASSKGRKAEEAARASQKAMGDVSSLGAAKAALSSLVAKLESKLDKQIAENVQLNEKLKASEDYIKELTDKLRTSAGEKRDLQRKVSRLEASLEEARAHAKLDSQTIMRLDKANKAMGTVLARVTIENKRLKASLANIFDSANDGSSNTSGGSFAQPGAPRPPLGPPEHTSLSSSSRPSSDSVRHSRRGHSPSNATSARSGRSQSDEMAKLAADVSGASGRDSTSPQASERTSHDGSPSTRPQKAESSSQAQDQQSAEMQRLIEKQLAETVSSATVSPAAGSGKEN